MHPVLKPLAVYLYNSSAKDALRQEAELRKFLTLRGWTNPVVFKESTSFQEFMNQMKDGEFSAILVWNLASLARSWKDLIEFLNYLAVSEVGLVSLSDNIDTTNTTKDFQFETFVQALIKFQSDLRSLQIREGIAKAKKQGKAIGRRSRLPIDEVHRLRYLGYTLESVGRRLGGTKSAISKILSKHPQPAHLPRPIKLNEIFPWLATP